MERSADDDFSVYVVASDLGIDARSLLSPAERQEAGQDYGDGDDDDCVVWHDCPSSNQLLGDSDFSDLDGLQAFRLEGSDKAGNRILRIVGKYFPATTVSVERLKRYVHYKLHMELAEGTFCILYMHSTASSEENNPGMSTLRCLYENLPPDYKDRLQAVYFLHPGLRSRLVLATLGRYLLSGGLYWKIKYISRLQYLWEDIKKGQVEIPEIVQKHDEILEHRPLTDYGIEPDPLRLTEVPAMEYSLGRYEDKLNSRYYM